MGKQHTTYEKALTPNASGKYWSEDWENSEKSELGKQTGIYLVNHIWSLQIFPEGNSNNVTTMQIIWL